MEPKEECPHLLVDGNGVCVNCGHQLPLEEAEKKAEAFREVLAETFGKRFVILRPLDLGDIKGICDLAKGVWEQYQRTEAKNHDPRDPSKPKMRIIGGVIVRLQPEDIFRDLTLTTYKQAKGMGYRGSYEKWCDFVREQGEEPEQLEAPFGNPL